jgi:tetratricopeptide (TPR) repeat protein
MQLNKALARRIGERRLATVHFFASEYYRIVFESQENMSLEALDAFVYHCFASGSQRVRAAYEYLFDGDILTGLHNAGMALQLKGILQKLNENVEDFSPLQQCRLLIEMAHVNSDLSEFEESLELMKKAEATLEEMRDDADDFIRADLLKQIWYYSAIAYSNTGFSNECLRSYFKIISSASADNSIDRLACLCLAYFSHDLKYRDIEMALTCGAKALEIARMIDDSSLIAKSLCSLGETQLYTPDLDQADLCFEEANSLCLQNRTGSADLRERGRVLKNWGLVALIRNDLGRARERLEEAKRISASMGDRRRVASADLYLGILCYRLGDATEGNTYIASSVRALAGLGDGRYLVPAIMTYALINDPTYSGKRRELLDSIPCKPFSDIVSGVAESERFEVFARFWRDHFRPVVLGS